MTTEGERGPYSFLDSLGPWSHHGDPGIPVLPGAAWGLSGPVLASCIPQTQTPLRGALLRERGRCEVGHLITSVKWHHCVSTPLTCSAPLCKHSSNMLFGRLSVRCTIPQFRRLEVVQPGHLALERHGLTVSRLLWQWHRWFLCCNWFANFNTKMTG